MTKTCGKGDDPYCPELPVLTVTHTHTSVLVSAEVNLRFLHALEIHSCMPMHYTHNMSQHTDVFHPLPPPSNAVRSASQHLGTLHLRKRQLRPKYREGNAFRLALVQIFN